MVLVSQTGSAFTSLGLLPSAILAISVAKKPHITLNGGRSGGIGCLSRRRLWSYMGRSLKLPWLW
ncbi:exported hypothetical protein [Bradyrhizobium sp. STM 3843]|nr:exported hypothetical protein [Bradyrhizobium sp. STM 3843]